MRFESPYFLLLFIVLLPISYIAWKRKNPSLIIPSIISLKKVSNNEKINLKNKIPLILEIISLSLLIIALARPQKGIEELKQRAEGIDIMLVLDLSGSMSAIDITPEYKTAESIRNAIINGKLRTRAEIAKDEIRKFIESRPNDRIGMIAFGPLPYLAAPPTLDRSWIYKQIEKLNAGDLGDSTNIASSIASAVSRLKNSNAKRKVIILFTDGKHNTEARISPIQAAKIAKDYGIIIHTVGIGNENAFIIVDTLFGRQLQQISFEFDEKLLKEIAKITGGLYFQARDTEGLKRTLDEINKLEKTSFEEPKFIDYKELAFPILSSGIILLIISLILSKTILLKIP